MPPDVKRASGGKSAANRTANSVAEESEGAVVRGSMFQQVVIDWSTAVCSSLVFGSSSVAIAFRMALCFGINYAQSMRDACQLITDQIRSLVRGGASCFVSDSRAHH